MKHSKHASYAPTILVVDDFGVKYVGYHHVKHLVRTLMELYEVSIDWKGDTYIGLIWKWNYEKRQVILLMS